MDTKNIPPKYRFSTQISQSHASSQYQNAKSEKTKKYISMVLTSKPRMINCYTVTILT